MQAGPVQAGLEAGRAAAPTACEGAAVTGASPRQKTRLEVSSGNEWRRLKRIVVPNLLYVPAAGAVGWRPGRGAMGSGAGPVMPL